jgi:hypothetical protein
MTEPTGKTPIEGSEREALDRPPIGNAPGNELVDVVVVLRPDTDDEPLGRVVTFLEGHGLAVENVYKRTGSLHVRGSSFGDFTTFTYANPGDFTDVTVGNHGAYSAGPGWDPASGLASPVGEKLLAALAPAPATSPAPAPSAEGTSRSGTPSRRSGRPPTRCGRWRRTRPRART